MFFSKNNVIVSEFKNCVTQTLVITMLSSKCIKEPMMHFLYDDRSISTGYFSKLTGNLELKSQLSGDYKQYLLVLAYHAFGAGIYVSM